MTDAALNPESPFDIFRSWLRSLPTAPKASMRERAWLDEMAKDGPAVHEKAWSDEIKDGPVMRERAWLDEMAKDGPAVHEKAWLDEMAKAGR